MLESLLIPLLISLPLFLWGGHFANSHVYYDTRGQRALGLLMSTLSLYLMLAVLAAYIFAAVWIVRIFS